MSILLSKPPHAADALADIPEIDDACIEPLSDEVEVRPPISEIVLEHSVVAQRAFRIWQRDRVADPFRNWVLAEAELRAGAPF